VRVLIAGCGFVGTELGRQLAAAGHEPWGLKRDPSSLPAGIRPVRADLLDPTLESRLPEVDAVVYAAAADASTPEGYRAAYVDGVRNLQRALLARSGGVRRFLFTSSTAVWGGTDGGWVDEDTPTAPDGFRGSVVLEGEAIVRESPFPGVVLRLGGIYGPGRRRLIERVRSGEARCAEDPASDPWSNRVHRDDAAGILSHLLTLEAPAPVYIGVDDEPARLCEVYRYVAELLGAPPPGTGSARGEGRPGSKRCSNRRLRALGYRFRFPTYREGYRAMIEDGGGGADRGVDTDWEGE
jgi:nucleoside-diphosphate-sugar epimerase